MVTKIFYIISILYCYCLKVPTNSLGDFGKIHPRAPFFWAVDSAGLWTTGCPQPLDKAALYPHYPQPLRLLFSQNQTSDLRAQKGQRVPPAGWALAGPTAALVILEYSAALPLRCSQSCASKESPCQPILPRDKMRAMVINNQLKGDQK